MREDSIKGFNLPTSSGTSFLHSVLHPHVPYVTPLLFPFFLIVLSHMPVPEKQHLLQLNCQAYHSFYELTRTSKKCILPILPIC